MRWLSIYIYLNGPMDEFLVLVLKPQIESILKNNYASSFFFIRFVDEAQHIRLRIYGDSTVLETIVYPLLESNVLNYIRKQSNTSNNESSTTITERQAELIIQRKIYDREINRYGGEYGMTISERQFNISSETILALLGNLKDWNYNKILGNALKLHVSFAHAFKFTASEVKEFFFCFYKNWETRIYYKAGVQPTEFETASLEIRSGFEELFQKQRPTLLPIISELWTKLEAAEEFEDTWLNYWISGLSDVRQQLDEAASKSRLLFPMLPAYKSKKQIWPILDSYVHMTNNRLGIPNVDEAYLGFLISECFTAIENKLKP